MTQEAMLFILSLSLLGWLGWYWFNALVMFLSRRRKDWEGEEEDEDEDN